MDLQLRGKRAIVTGGSAGIGRAIARELAAEGVDVALTSRSAARAKAAAEEIAADLAGSAESGSAASGSADSGSAYSGVAEPGRLLPVEVEMRDPDGVTELVRSVAAELGGVDVLVNNAAVVSGNQAEDLNGVTDELVLTSFEEKFLGTLRACRAVAPLMAANGFGRILNIAGHKARESGAIAAGARNAAVVHLTRTLAVELGRSGITVNAVLPFTTVTETLESRMASVASRKGISTEEHLAAIAARTSLGRLVTAQEVARFVTFLASPLSVAMTGEVVALTGGVDRTIHV